MEDNNILFVTQLIHMPEFAPWPSEKEVLKIVGSAASIAYESKDDDEACRRRVLHCLRHKHMSVFEHVNMSLVIDCDRATANALVRHRHCSFTQASTIYVKQKCMHVIDLPQQDPITGAEFKSLEDDKTFMSTLQSAWNKYKTMLDSGKHAGEARDILPLCLHTRLYMTTNLREWLYIADIRKDMADSPRMHVFADQLNMALKDRYPIIYEEYTGDNVF